MKQNRIAHAVAVVLLASASGAAFASDSQSLTVTATVSAVCKFVAVPAISFTIDPSLTGNQTGNATVTYKCTNGQSPTFATGAGTLTGRTLTFGAATMAYDLSVSGATAGDGFSGAAQSMTLTATVGQAAYQDAVAGAYTETLSLTVNP
jgi:spore coat protein U-like protein